jgi:signal transduction histidine kinase
MQRKKRRARGLALAFAGIVIAFVAATIIADWRTFAIDGETEALLGNALPSLQYLGDINDAARAIEATLDELFDADDARPALRASIDENWRRIDTALARYRALPTFPGERELFAEVPVALRELDGSVRTTMTEADHGMLEQARLDADAVVRPRANRVTHLVRQVVQLNATHAVDSATRIDRTRHSTVALSVVLNVIATLLTLASALWVFRLVRAHDQLLEEQLGVEARRTAELEMFGQRVAHDLLSPLSSLTFNLGAFKKVAARDPKLDGALARARQCVGRAHALVSTVFEFSRSGGAPDRDARCSVRHAVEAVVEEADANAKNEKVELSVGPMPECAVRCSQGVLESMLGNLVRNAIKYMGDSLERRVTIRATELDTMVRFQVSDTGPGIARALAETVFQPYVRGEGVTQAGLGLGLATVKRFSEAYGGSVVLRSAVGRGSVFQLTLPKALATDAKGPESARTLIGGTLG